MYDKPDFYSKKAKKEGYFARSIYKLEEIQKKYNLFKKGQKILDIGCAPGSWSQYVLSQIGVNGFLVGIDFKEIKVSAANAIFIKGDFLKEENQLEIKKYAPFDGIISDMAPDTTGDKYTDNIRSSLLVEEALNFSFKNLKKGGFFIAKIFQGGDEKEIMEKIKKAFVNGRWFKPKSSRSISNEIFIVAWNFIKEPEEKKEEKLDGIFEQDYDGTMPW